MKSALRLLWVSLLLLVAACSQDETALQKPLDLAAPSSTETAKVALTNGAPVGNLSGARSSQRYDSITVPSGATNLQISISGGTGDADLYVRFGSRPTTGSYDCRPYRTGNSETCSFSAPRAGTYQIMLRGYTAYSGVTLSASYSGGTTPPNLPAPSGGFNVTFVFGANVTNGQKAIFEQAGARWSQVITGDLADVAVNKQNNLCGAGEPAYNGTVDDVVIYAEVGSIDGPGSTLAQAGPCLIRSGGVTSYGVMSFDSADVNSFDLASVILHEMGHVLGIGTLWPRFGLVNYSSGSCPTAPRYSGSSARGEWNALGGGGNIPVEQNGGGGTACGHWDEETFNAELMTGYVESGAMPLSKMTVSSLQDMNYTVNKGAADVYSLPSCSPSCNSVALQGLNIATGEVLLEPVGISLPDGTTERIEYRR